MLDLLNLEPHKVSTDLRGYSVMFYGEPKSGKTTAATKFPKTLLLAFEKGYATLAGVFAVPINTWSDFLKVLRQLKDQTVKDKFSTIAVDTADLAYELCEQYICAQAGVDTVGDIPYGAGYARVAKEFDSKLRSIVQQDYGLVLISHSTDKVFKDENGDEYNKIIPTLPSKARLITTRMCDIIAYSRSVDTDEGSKTMLFMRGTPRFEAGSRFKHTPDVIEFSYENLVGAIKDAIEKESEETGATLSSKKDDINTKNIVALDFDVLMAEFLSTVNSLMEKNAKKYKPLIEQVVESHLGIGKKATELTRNQVGLLDIIIFDLKDLA